MAYPFRRNPKAPWLLLCALLLLVSAAELWARAGGGHSSGGGGGGSSGGGGSGGRSGSGSGGGDGLIMLIRGWWWLMTHHPLIGVPVTAAGAYAIYRSGKGTKNAYVSGVIRRGARAIDQNLVAKGLREICKNDPAFTANAFGERVRVAFVKLQKAWCAQELVTVRPFISDGIHERFSLQFEEQHALRYRGSMSNLEILGCDPAEVECGPVFEVVTMRIAARAHDVRVSSDTGKPIPGTEEQTQFVEFWSFIRTRGSRTVLNKAGLIEGKCPNCGAAIEMNQGAKCQYCQALLRSGQFDWVLAEITQEGEWKPRTKPAPGTLRIRDRDPGFNLQDLEDTTSVVFWRKATADRLGSINPMRKVADPAWCDMYSAALEPGNGGERRFTCDCAVSAVDTVGVIPGETEDRALVEVWWMGKPFEAAADGSLRPTGTMTMRQTLFVLARKAGSLTQPEASVSSAHCPSCGGAVTFDTSNACEFCGTILNDGSHWVLRELLPNQSSQAAALVAEAVATSRRDEGHFEALRSPGRAGATGGLAWIIHSVVANGAGNDDSIRDMLEAAAKRHKVRMDRVQEMVNMAAAGQLEVPEPANPVETQAWITDMAVAAMATGGGISKAEQKLLVAVGARYGLAPVDVTQCINRARKDAYAIAKDEIRSARRERKAAKREAKG